MRLIRVISGGQNGVDIAGVRAGKDSGFEVGGTMPKGFRTLDGPRPEYARSYGMVEHSSDAYPPRTFTNVRDSDATLRIAFNMESSGERCTLNAINQYGKLHFDVHVADVTKFVLPAHLHPTAAAQWIVENDIETLNIAGNSEKTAPGIEAYAYRYVTAVLSAVKIR